MGSNELPVTPVPEYVPPEGDACVKVNAGDVVHSVGIVANEIVGKGLTVTVTHAVPVQPKAVPPTVYIVVAAGVTTAEFPGKLPGIHANVVPVAEHDAFNVELPPGQTPGGVGVAVITMLELTITATVSDPEQPPARVIVTV